MKTHRMSACKGALSALVVIAALSACSNKAPTGQVVAVVNGEEITRRELAAEPVSLNADAAQATPAAMLSGVVDRKLAVAEARRLSLHETPQFVAQKNRLEEVMLSRALFDRWAGEMPRPSGQAIAAYITDNPQRFAGRKLFLVDRIETAEEIDQQALAPLPTNDAVAALLRARAQSFSRDRAVLDSATLPAAFYQKLSALAPGEPLASAENGQLVVLAVVTARDAPLSATEREDAAIAALKQVDVQRRLAALRKSAKIAYQPGYRQAVPLSDKR